MHPQTGIHQARQNRAGESAGEGSSSGAGNAGVCREHRSRRIGLVEVGGLCGREPHRFRRVSGRGGPAQGESRRLEFRWEAFNAFNSVRYDVRGAQPSLSYSASQFGRYLGTLTTPRFMQFSLRFVF